MGKIYTAIQILFPKDTYCKVQKLIWLKFNQKMIWISRIEASGTKGRQESLPAWPQ